MKIVEQTIQTEQTIKKSVFICTLFPIQSVEEAKTALVKIQEEHPNATHHCYCYILGDNGAIIKYSDDGEPNQTAGIVIYEVLRKNNITNTLAVVTRYFGGIKLGAGGLVRAYASSTAKSVAAGAFQNIRPFITIEVHTTYEAISLVERTLFAYEILNKSYLTTIVYTYKIPLDELEVVAKTIENLSYLNTFMTILP